MEKELNIAAILKDKPQGTILYTPMFGECSFDHITHSNGEIWVKYKDSLHFFDKYGRAYSDGECMLFPSKEMQDWQKFSWKKGDVLYCAGLKEYCVFNKFISDNYLVFISRYNFDENIKSVVPKTYDPDRNTAYYEKVSDEKASEIISLIEEHYGGKLNLSALEIEKQPEFKDGEIITEYSNMPFVTTYIFKSFDEYGDNTMSFYCYLQQGNFRTSKGWVGVRKKFIFRPATDSEKQQLFDALAKEGKRWDNDKKKLVDLPKKHKFKSFDKVLVRNATDEIWHPRFFAYYVNDMAICMDESEYTYCIPYNDATANLAGTTNDYKGGKQ